ncbi:MAG: deoxyribodipyrimidine photo-lyase/cryptochrome family protein [Roseobacter sp.]|nr:deoxyribodipyrimidine photo-lyase/cryptochrome family protein [Roseobacter sp.]
MRLRDLQVVWFKRDLRSFDNRALAAAAARGPVLPLYVVEPELWAGRDMSARQWAFVAETLVELRGELARLGQGLVVRQGEICRVLERIRAEHGAFTLWAHEETGNGWTYARDRRVAGWCRAAGLAFCEIKNHGVTRALATRNGWAASWDSFMGEPLTAAPRLRPLGDLTLGAIPSAKDLGLAPERCDGRQRGGRRAGLERLHSFLSERAPPYRKAMSSPLAGARHCSRLSPYLAWGALSMREVHQANARRRVALAERPNEDRRFPGALKAFSGRLHWHCHFIQKLEDAPRLEYENLHRAYDGLRPATADATRLGAFSEGETGLPFVDACLRSLRATGWLNFRMRAMVQAVASYHLWLPWQESGAVLARLFTDYEPGIHWSQVQMQSGTTGMNTVRIYNPVKQGYDQDPTGAFTRRWLPELGPIDDAFVQEPWRAPNAAQVLGRAYPEPVVEPASAAQAAREAVWAVRKGPLFREEAQRLLVKHASRKAGRSGTGRGRANSAKPSVAQAQAQMRFSFGQDDL